MTEREAFEVQWKNPLPADAEEFKEYFWDFWQAACAWQREQDEFDRRRTIDDFTTVVANALHSFDAAGVVARPNSSYKDVLDSNTGGISRYRNDAGFHARVATIVARLARVLHEQDERADKIRSGA